MKGKKRSQAKSQAAKRSPQMAGLTLSARLSVTAPMPLICALPAVSDQPADNVSSAAARGSGGLVSAGVRSKGVVSFKNVARGETSGITRPQNVAIRSANEWASLWQAHTSIQISPPPAPRIDFSREMVVGVFLGNRPSAGFAVSIQRIARDGDRLMVEACETRPKPGAITASVVTQPYHLVRLPSSTDPVDFRLN